MNFIIHLFETTIGSDRKANIIEAFLPATPKVGESLLHETKIYQISHIIYQLNFEKTIIVANLDESPLE